MTEASPEAWKPGEACRDDYPLWPQAEGDVELLLEGLERLGYDGDDGYDFVAQKTRHFGGIFFFEHLLSIVVTKRYPLDPLANVYISMENHNV